MNLSPCYLRGLLLATGLSVATLCVEAQQQKNRSDRPHVAIDSKNRAVIFQGNPLGGTKQGPTVKASKDIPATGVASIANGQVTGVTVTKGGHYPRTESSFWSGSRPGDLTLDVVFSGGGGSGAAGTVGLHLNSVGVDPTLYWYVVKSVRITKPGSGYTSPPTVTFVVKP